jgi:hypothetical protein
MDAIEIRIKRTMASLTEEKKDRTAFFFDKMSNLFKGSSDFDRIRAMAAAITRTTSSAAES